jgi:hypothetical protein
MLSCYWPYGPLPHSDEHSTCLYPQVYKLNAHNPIYFFQIHINIIVQSMHRFSKKFSSLGFSYQNVVCISLLYHICFMTRPSSSVAFDHPSDIYRGVQILKLLVMQFFSSLLLIYPVYIHSPQRRVLKISQFMNVTVFWMWRCLVWYLFVDVLEECL